MPRRASIHRTAHPAVRGTLIHAALALGVLVGVMPMMLCLPAGAPRILAPLLVAGYVLATAVIVLTGVVATLSLARTPQEPPRAMRSGAQSGQDMTPLRS